MIATRCSAWVAGTGQSNLACYSMTKGALVTMTKHAAWALRRHHIRVNYLAVGWLLGSIDLGPEALFSDPRKNLSHENRDAKGHRVLPCGLQTREDTPPPHILGWLSFPRLDVHAS